MAKTAEPKAYMAGKDFFLKPDGSAYHLGVKKGDIFPRIITVGSSSRAKIVAKHFDKEPAVREFHSDRDMHTYSGYYKGVGISVIAIGMGAPMMDFMLREASYCEDGPMAVIRLGSCGIFNPDQLPGTVMCAGKGSVYIEVNYSHWTGCFNDPGVSQKNAPYLICNPVPCDKVLNDLMTSELKTVGCKTYDGLNACGETFYGCQGRKDAHFKDENENIVPDLLKQGVDFVEMETHQLFHLASIRKEKCATACCAIGLVNRTNDKITVNITAEKLHEMESDAGKACLAALATYKL